MQAPYWVSLGLILWPGITAVLHWASGLAMVPVQASTFRFAQWALSHDAIHNRFPTARTKLQAVKDMYDKQSHRPPLSSSPHSILSTWWRSPLPLPFRVHGSAYHFRRHCAALNATVKGFCVHTPDSGKAAIDGVYLVSSGVAPGSNPSAVILCNGNASLYVMEHR